MVAISLSALLLGASLVGAAPISQRRAATTLKINRLDAAATARAMERDATATRAVTGQSIKTANGQCLQVTSGTGDFRENLIPIEIKVCDDSAGQKFDVITKGKHNNGNAGQALIVSSLTQGCINFDPRRAAGNQALLFSCGGRADGDGLTTGSQLFPFVNAGAPLALTPFDAKTTCLTAKNGLLDQTACTGAELFTFGNAAAAPVPAPAPAPVPVPAPVPAPAPAPAPPATALPVTRLDAAATAQAMQRDGTATRAVTGQTLKAADGTCLTVTSGTGDFRENLIPIEMKACDGSAGQKFDVITKGKHNNGNDRQALIVSSLTQGCLNFDPRRAAGNQVLLFSCGGRADGEGLTTGSQLFPFVNAAAPLALTPFDAKTTCLTPKNGRLDQTTCTGAELFTFGNAAAAPAPATPAPAPATPAPAPATPAAPAPAAPATTLTVGRLDAAAVAEAMQRDATATRAVTGKAIKAADGTCLTVTSGTGDFRENLVPIEMKACDGSAGQKFDVITKGKHNDGTGNGALIVSSLTQGCINFDPRRAAGNQVLLFSCGGRADGSGLTQPAQLYPFKDAATPLALAPLSAQTTCLTPKAGRLDQKACTGAELFTFV